MGQQTTRLISLPTVSSFHLLPFLLVSYCFLLKVLLSFSVPFSLFFFHFSLIHLLFTSALFPSFLSPCPSTISLCFPPFLNILLHPFLFSCVLHFLSHISVLLSSRTSPFSFFFLITLFPPPFLSSSNPSPSISPFLLLFFFLLASSPSSLHLLLFFSAQIKPVFCPRLYLSSLPLSV